MFLCCVVIYRLWSTLDLSCVAMLQVLSKLSQSSNSCRLRPVICRSKEDFLSIIRCLSRVHVPIFSSIIEARLANSNVPFLSNETDSKNQ